MDAHFTVYFQNPNPPPRTCAQNGRIRSEMAGGGGGVALTNFLTRRIENVRGEFSLTALAYNIRRALTLVGVDGLMRAISA